jgi:D-glycero-beta-D-manno-heptose 1-phosphate adenylyltransferase
MSIRKILSREKAVAHVHDLKRRGRKVVFTNGCFDILHPGHARYLQAAKELGDILIVAINSDRSVRTIKGPNRPIMPQAERAEVMAALESVDFVTIFDEPTPRELITEMLPNVLVKGGDWALDQIIGREEVEAAGGTVVSIPVVEGYSTSRIIQGARRSA